MNAQQVEDWCTFPQCQTKARVNPSELEWTGPAVSFEQATVFGPQLDNYARYRRRIAPQIRTSDGEPVPWNFDCPHNVQLIVAQPPVAEARHLLDSFDLDVCQCSFDGQQLDIASWWSLWSKQAIVQPRFAKILAVAMEIKQRFREAQRHPGTTHVESFLLHLIFVIFHCMSAIVLNLSQILNQHGKRRSQTRMSRRCVT
jgi:hypothetical protein